MPNSPPSQHPLPGCKTASLTDLYDQLVKDGYQDDPLQRHVLGIFESLIRAFTANNNGLDKLFKRKTNRGRGVYLWGGVGGGKSMLMDLFYRQAPVERKTRIHFHAFMQDVHSRIHRIRKEGSRGKSGADPVIVLAQQLAEETALLCFDELQATDVADATLLYRLFSVLFEAGVVVVGTSNHPPSSLYTGGVQRERFDKFITLIEEHMEVVPLSSPRDYRHSKMQAMRQAYVYPLGAEADRFVADALYQLCMNAHPKTGTISVKGRDIGFTLFDDSIGKFTFGELCGTALGPADYLEFARRLDTVILTGIPKLPPEKRNEARRFVTLIDALYEHKVKLLATAAVPPEEIYSDGDGAFEFQRTVSRLKEMQSEAWLSN